MKSFIHILLVGVLIATPAQAFAIESGFNDVPESNKHADAIYALVKKGILRGYDDGLFRPSNPVSRVELLKIAMLSLNIPRIQGGDVPFPDLIPSAWYVPYVKAAVQKGDVRGFGDGTFKPNKTVSKIEALKIIFELMDVSDFMDQEGAQTLHDVDATHWSRKYIRYALDRGLLDQKGGHFSPDQGMSRGEVAELIFRLKHILDNDLILYPYAEIEIPVNQGIRDKGTTKASFYSDALIGQPTASGEPFDNQAFTAAHRTLDYGTKVKVTNIQNGKSVLVKINDRGPFVEGRNIDLTKRAFSVIAPVSQGVAEVVLEIMTQQKELPKGDDNVPRELNTRVTEINTKGELITSDNTVLRILGVYVPLEGHPFHQDVLRTLESLAYNKKINAKICQEEVKDRNHLAARIKIDTVDLTSHLIEEGLTAFKKDDPCITDDDELVILEREAKQEKRGRWESLDEVALQIVEVHNSGSGMARSLLNQEWVTISNNSDGPINLLGYQLRDQGDTRYTFGNVILGAGKSLKVHSGSSRDTTEDLYWGNETQIWNDARDEATLLDPKEEIIHVFKYPSYR